MSAGTDTPRFEFGKNWSNFVTRRFSPERAEAAKKHLLEFMKRDSLKDLDFLDVGCGSGLHSLAAFGAGAGRLRSFDYDPNSVAATTALWEKAGRPQNWIVEQGDALDEGYIAKLGKWSFVYSWGVLHHTGSMWQAIRNVQGTVAEGGLFYLALYSADADFQPSKEFWLEIKKEYNRVSPTTRRLMALWYVWRFDLLQDIRNLPKFIRKLIDYKFQRGMSVFVDIHDWIGGWPMEYAGDQETVDLLEGEYGFELVNVSTGQACSEFLFKRTGVMGKKTNVKEMVSRISGRTAPIISSAAI